MVIIAICCPSDSMIQLFKDGKKSCFDLSLGSFNPALHYRPWEASKDDIINYLHKVQEKSDSLLDYLIVVIHDDFRNSFRKKFLRIAECWISKEKIQLIDQSHISLFGAVTQLKTGPADGEVIWEIKIDHHFIRCKVWTYKQHEEGWVMLKSLCQEYHALENHSAPDPELFYLESILLASHPNLPNIFFFGFNNDQKEKFSKTFTSYKSSNFTRDTYNPVKMALKYGRGLAGNEESHLKFRCKPISNRCIEVKENGHIILEISKNDSLPASKITTISNSTEKSNDFQVFESGRKTSTLKFTQHGEFQFILNATINGIYEMYELNTAGQLCGNVEEI